MGKCVLRFFVALFAALVVFAALGQSTVAASGGCTIDHEERSVLTTVLKSMSEDSRSVLVVESRTDSSHFARTFSLGDLLSRDAISELPSQLKATPSGSAVFVTSPAPIVPQIRQHELEQEYKAKLSQPCGIPAINNDSKLELFRTPVQVKEIFSGNDPIKAWRRFHRLFGDDAELLRFSRVAFDRAKQYALVHVSSGLSEMAGGGELYLLTRLNGNWVIKRTFSTWAT
jgi:hypothetical protein